MDDRQTSKIKDFLMETGKISSTAGLAAADTALFSGYPILSTVGQLVKSYFDMSVRFRTKHTMEVFEYIYNNQASFTKEIMNTEAFQEGFLSWFNRYLLLRSHEKRLGALLLFKSFAEEDHKYEFPLERYMDTLDKISPNALRALSFLKYKVIIPDMDRNPNNNIHRRTRIEDYASQRLSSTPLSSITDRVISELSLMSKEEYARYEELPPAEKQNYMRKWEQKSRTLRENFYNHIDELIYLGLIVQESKPSNDKLAFSSDDTGGWWRISIFAAKFIHYIESVGEPDDTGERIL